MQEKNVGNMIFAGRRIQAQNRFGKQHSRRRIGRKDVAHARRTRKRIAVHEKTISVTMNDVIRNNASMDAEHKEEQQRMQAHFAQLSRNAQEEKHIAIARTNSKLQVADCKQ